MKFPIQHIIFEVIQECNLSCLYCYNHWRRIGHTVRQTGFSETRRTLDRIVKTVDFEHITFTGGEPFLADGLKEQVLRCRMKGKGVTIVTNGTTANAGDYEILADMGVSLFELPLHAESPEIHDRLTGVNGSFERVVDSIGRLLKLKTEICVAVVLTKLNINQLHRTLEFARRLGVKRIMLARFNIGGRGIEHINTLLPSLDELRAAFTTANMFVSQSDMRISSNVCVPRCIIDPGDYPKIPISSCGSIMTRRPITIDTLGNVRICNHSPQNIGNIFSEDIGSMFNSTYVKAWERVCPEYCSGCEHWANCRGGCRAASEQMGRPLQYADPLIELIRTSEKHKTDQTVTI